jgi:hypothetical protein
MELIYAASLCPPSPRARYSTEVLSATFPVIMSMSKHCDRPI